MSNHAVASTPSSNEKHLLIACALALIVAWTLWAGKDANWDVYNHQLYLPFSLMSGRYAADLFAAGPQSYQNPLGYLPFYALVRAELPSWVVGCALGLIHGLAIWPLHALAVSLWGTGSETRWTRVLAVAAAFAAPTFMLVAGTTSVDPICGVLVLASLAAAIDSRLSPARMVLGGAALGLAIAIKPTNLVFAVAVATVLLGRWTFAQTTARGVLAFGAGLCGAVLAGAGYWSAWLWSTFDSPLFPLFNQVFHSPFAPSGPTVAGRFLPATAWDYLTRPLELAEFRSYTSTEAFAPDLRPLLALIALAALAGRHLILGRLTNMLTRPFWQRSDVQLTVFAAVAYVLWMATSGNSRYAVALFMAFGLVLASALDCLLPKRAIAPTLGAVLAAQLYYHVGDGDHRYYQSRWTQQPFFSVHASPRLQQEPFLHLSVGMQSFSAVAPYLHPRGALANVIGQFSLPTEGPLGNALKQRIAAWNGRVRFLFHVPPNMDDPDKSALVHSKLDYLTYRLRMRVDWSDCESITIDGETIGEPGGAQVGKSSHSQSGTTLWSCRSVQRTDVNSKLEADLIRADRVFALMEARCPRIYGPIPMVSDIGETVFQRRYANYDVRVSVSETEGVSLTHFRSQKLISMGSIDHVIANGGLDACTAWKKLNAP